MSSAPASSPFFFVAVTAAGGKKFGMRSAPSESALQDALRRDRLLLLRAWKAPQWAAPSSATQLSLKDQTALNEQLAALLKRGVPLVEALEVAATVLTPKAQAMALKLRDLVGAGASFAGACEQVGGFDPAAIAVYRAAERTGELGDAAHRLGVATRRRLAVAQKAVTLMIYPAVVLAIAFIVCGAMLMIIVPRIGTALRDALPELPWFSELIFDLGDWMRANALLVIGVVLLTVVGFVVLRKVIVGAVLALGRRLPAVARFQVSVEATRFFSTMAALTRSGVPVADSLAIGAQTVSHPAFRTQLETIRRRLIEGGLFRNLVEELQALPVATRRLLVAAERSGDLDAAFDNLAEDLAEDVDRQSDRLLAVLGPLTVVVMFTVVGSLLVAIMLPLLSISQSIQ